MALVDLGVYTAYDFAFEVAFPNYRAFMRAPSSMTAMNAAWALWHLREWCNYDNKETSGYVKSELLRQCPRLAWLKDIANASKHRELTSSHPVVSQLRSHLVTRSMSMDSLGGSTTEFTILVGGKTHNFTEVIDEVYIFWIGKVLPHHVGYRVRADEQGLKVRGDMEGWCRQRLGNESLQRRKWALLPLDNYTGHYAFLERVDADDFRQAYIDGILVFPL
jgi:hypothetical protein